MQCLDSRDRALTSRIVLGVTATCGLLDAVVDERLRGGVRLEPQVRDALRLASFDLLFLSTPAAVAVNEGVELVRAVRTRAAGLANAVLRSIATHVVPAREAALARMESGNASLDDMALVSGYPTWLLSRVREDRGIGVAWDFAMASLEPAPVWVVGNAARHTSEEVLGLLEDAGLSPRAVSDVGVGVSFELGSPSSLATSGLVDAVDVVVCDRAAQRVASHVMSKPGMRVLEVGQGRGTKSILLQNTALAQGGSARIEGIDAEAFKVEVARQRMDRAGLGDCVTCHALDGRLLAREDELAAQLRGPFERVLLDAPCSGTGTLRRHPEIAWGLSPHAVRAVASLQLDLLTAASARVAPGGALVYATCSVLREENERVVERFLATDEGTYFSCAGDTLQTHPSLAGADGHFCATLVRHA